MRILNAIAHLEERRQLEKALYFKGVGIPKQACFRCVASQCKAKCSVLRHGWEPESSKESSISFLLVEKEKKLLAEQRLAFKDFKLVG